MNTEETIKDVKAALRAAMNGPVAQSMRQKGLTYRMIFGVELPRLREMAHEWEPSFTLAAALWKEDIRECRLLAGLLMPPEAFSAELADVWVEQMRFPEEAEATALHLFSRLSDASSLAFCWIASGEEMRRLCGFLIISRLLMQGAVPGERDAAELLDQIAAELAAAPTLASRAAQTTLLRFMELGETQERAGERIIEGLSRTADGNPA